MKLLFLSGTPMYNDPKEILFLINLLNMNDNRSILYNKEVFDKEMKAKGYFQIIKRSPLYICKKK